MNTIRVSNILDPDQALRFVLFGPDVGPNSLWKISADNKVATSVESSFICLHAGKIFMLFCHKLNFFKINCFEKKCPRMSSECQPIWIKIRLDKMSGEIRIKTVWLTDGTQERFVCLTAQSTIFQFCLDRSSWVEPVLSKDYCVLLMETMQWCRWGWNPQPFSLESSTLPLSLNS